MTTLHDVGEFGFIERITKHFGTRPDVLVGPGDDSAVVRVGDRILLVTCDLAMEDVHFRRGIVAAEDLGWKAAAAGLSDIAAMGGAPLFLAVSLAAPGATETEELAAFCDGMAKAAAEAGAAVIGGDVTGSSDGVVADVMVIGEAPGGRYVSRNGAQSGDMFAVTGWPGRSAAGLDAQEKGIDAAALIRAHYHPQPRILEGQWLCREDAVHAMIDVSDGVVQDAGHLCERSGLGVAMTSASVAVDPVLADFCAHSDKSLQDYVFTGGEAYELAFAIDRDRFGEVLDAFRSEFKLPVTVLGQFSDEFQGVMIDGARPADIGYEHFA